MSRLGRVSACSAVHMVDAANRCAHCRSMARKDGLPGPHAEPTEGVANSLRGERGTRVGAQVVAGQVRDRRPDRHRHRPVPARRGCHVRHDQRVRGGACGLGGGRRRRWLRYPRWGVGGRCPAAREVPLVLREGQLPAGPGRWAPQRGQAITGDREGRGDAVGIDASRAHARVGARERLARPRRSALPAGQRAATSLPDPAVFIRIHRYTAHMPRNGEYSPYRMICRILNA